MKSMLKAVHSGKCVIQGESKTPNRQVLESWSSHFEGIEELYQDACSIKWFKIPRLGCAHKVSRYLLFVAFE